MNEHICHMDDRPCHNEPIPDHQQECRYWWNPIVIKKCQELRKEKDKKEDT